MRVAILTISDRSARGERADASGPAIQNFVNARLSAEVVLTDLVADDRAAISDKLAEWCDGDAADIIFTTGGTGFAPRDVTPEAVRPLFRREMDGFSVVFHQASLGTVGVSTLQSRAFAGQADDTFIFCLPGSTGACRDAWDLVLSLELDSRYRPCSLAGQIPRLRHLCA